MTQPTIPIGLATKAGLLVGSLAALLGPLATVLDGDQTPEALGALGMAALAFYAVVRGRMDQAAAHTHAEAAVKVARVAEARRAPTGVLGAGGANADPPADIYGGGEVSTTGGPYISPHAVLYERAVGPVPAGLELDHLCRNPGCVNPSHLEAVTHAENMRRGAVAKLSMREAQEIRRRRGNGETGRSLAAEFGVSPSCISAVSTGKTWGDS